MAEIGKDIMGLEVGHDVAVDNMLKALVEPRSEGEGPVFSWGVAVAFLKGQVQGLGDF